MIDRRKILTFAIVGAVALAVIIGIIVLVVVNQNSNDGGNDDTAVKPSASSSPTPTEGDEAEEALALFEDDYLSMAKSAAVIATSWNGATDPEVRTARYTQAGLAPELAASYTPVWAEIFGDNITAEITTTVDNNLVVNEVRGEKGSYVWRVAASVTFKGSWHEDGATQIQSAKTATWWLTIDQSTGEVTAIDQPSSDELQISTNEED